MRAGQFNIKCPNAKKKKLNDNHLKKNRERNYYSHKQFQLYIQQLISLSQIQRRREQSHAVNNNVVNSSIKPRFCDRFNWKKIPSKLS